MDMFQSMAFITPPNRNASFAETVAFNIYASRQDRIEHLINELAAVEDPNDELAQEIAFANAGFTDVNDLLPYEKEYVEKEIARRWQW